MTPEQAFEKWWQGYESDSVGGYDPYEKEVHMHQAFLQGIQYKELHQIGVLADIRKAVGDGEGKLMQEELVKKIQTLVAMTSVIHGNYITFSADDTMLIDGKSVMTEKEEA